MSVISLIDYINIYVLCIWVNQPSQCTGIWVVHYVDKQLIC